MPPTSRDSSSCINQLHAFGLWAIFYFSFTALRQQKDIPPKFPFTCAVVRSLSHRVGSANMRLINLLRTRTRRILRTNDTRLRYSFAYLGVAWDFYQRLPCGRGLERKARLRKDIEDVRTGSHWWAWVCVDRHVLHIGTSPVLAIPFSILNIWLYSLSQRTTPLNSISALGLRHYLRTLLAVHPLPYLV